MVRGAWRSIGYAKRQLCVPSSARFAGHYRLLNTHGARLGVSVCLHHALTSIAKQAQGKIEVHFKDKPLRTFDKVIVTTGGSPRATGLQYFS